MVDRKYFTKCSVLQASALHERIMFLSHGIGPVESLSHQRLGLLSVAGRGQLLKRRRARVTSAKGFCQKTEDLLNQSSFVPLLEKLLDQCPKCDFASACPPRSMLPPFRLGALWGKRHQAQRKDNTLKQIEYDHDGRTYSPFHLIVPAHDFLPLLHFDPLKNCF